MEKENKIEKSFTNSNLTLDNRFNLKLTGVEKVFETNENKVSLKVCGSVLTISGSNLAVEKLNTELGQIELSGNIDEIKYSTKTSRTSFIKRIFK